MRGESWQGLLWQRGWQRVGVRLVPRTVRAEKLSVPGPCPELWRSQERSEWTWDWHHGLLPTQAGVCSSGPRAGGPEGLAAPSHIHREGRCGLQRQRRKQDLLT